MPPSAGSACLATRPTTRKPFVSVSFQLSTAMSSKAPPHFVPHLPSDPAASRRIPPHASLPTCPRHHPSLPSSTTWRRGAASVSARWQGSYLLWVTDPASNPAAVARRPHSEVAREGLPSGGRAAHREASEVEAGGATGGEPRLPSHVPTPPLRSAIPASLRRHLIVTHHIRVTQLSGETKRRRRRGVHQRGRWAEGGVFWS